MVVFEANSLWYLVRQSDVISQLVLLILFFLSVLCWTFFFAKLLRMNMERRSIEKISTHLVPDTSLRTVLLYASNGVNTVGSVFVRHVALFIQHVLKQGDHINVLRVYDVEIISEYTYQLVDEYIESERATLPLLSTVAGLSPLLGLFGTVWGLVHAFIRISQQQSADIVTVAPGIAEALITTLAGLMVAIPALVMFNYLQKQMRDVENCLQKVADTVKIIVQCSVLKGHDAQK